MTTAKKQIKNNEKTIKRLVRQLRLELSMYTVAMVSMYYALVVNGYYFIALVDTVVIALMMAATSVSYRKRLKKIRKANKALRSL